MKKGKTLIYIVLLAAVFAAGYFAGMKGVGASVLNIGKTKEPQKMRSIEETIADYETAYNTGDFEKLTDCMSKSRSGFTSSVLSGLGKMASSFFGIDFSQDIMNTIWSLGAQSTQMKLTVHSIESIDDNNADVYLLIVYAGGEEFYKENGVTGICAKMNMVLEDGDWKIASDFIPIDADYNKI